MHVDTPTIVARLHPVALGLTLLIGACGSDPVDQLGPPVPADFDELCGEAAPLRLLPIDTDRVPTSVENLTFGDRHVFALGFGEPFSEDNEHEIWSVGHCGEDPVFLYEGAVSRVWAPPALDVPLVYNRESGEILALDPSGAQPPHAAFSGSMYRETSHGLVSDFVKGDTVDWVLQR